MPRPLIPDDDLYARLEVPVNASPETVELAWRSLLRRHHPDVDRDPAALERTKRINVAHDWLSDPDLRSRYDRERLHVRRHGQRPWHRSGGGARSGEAARPGGVAGWDAARPTSSTPTGARGARPPASPAERVTAFLDRVAQLRDDELARLSMAEPPPIAFLATLRRFLPAEDLAELDRVEAQVAVRVPASCWADLPSREALRAIAAELVVGRTLDVLLGEPFRSRARERLLRAWEAAIDQPRYGPNSTSVSALLDRIATLTPHDIAAFVRASAGIVATERPWPERLDPMDEEGLRVSAALADRDAQRAVATRTANVRGRRLVGRLAHVVALRHAFPATTYARLTAPWRAAIEQAGPDARQPGGHTVRRRSD